jgi:hypothetical protein
MGWVGGLEVVDGGGGMALASSISPVWSEDSVTTVSSGVLSDWPNGQLQPSQLAQYPIGCNGLGLGGHQTAGLAAGPFPDAGGCFVPETPFSISSAISNQLATMRQLNGTSLAANYSLGGSCPPGHWPGESDWNLAPFSDLLDFDPAEQHGGYALSPTASTMSSQYNPHLPRSVDLALPVSPTPRRYRCRGAHCSKRFKVLRDLERHTKNVHDGQRLECELCGAKLAMREDLIKRHLRTNKCMKNREKRQAREKRRA